MEDCDFEVRIPSVVNQDTRRSEGRITRDQDIRENKRPESLSLMP